MKDFDLISVKNATIFALFWKNTLIVKISVILLQDNLT